MSTDAAAALLLPSASAAPSRARLWVLETRALLRLAGPVAVAQVGMLTMGLVDTWMVGALGPLELGAVALGDACFFTFMVLAMGIVSALDPLISQAHGAGDVPRCAAAWRAGGRLALALTLPLALIVLSLGPLLRLAQLDPEVVRTTMAYVVPRTLGILPGLLFVTDRALLNNLGSTRPAMVVILLANLLNVVLDYAFIFGHWGAPALGVAGSGLTTSLCRWFMWIGLALWLRRGPYRAYTGLDPAVDPAIVRKAFRLGLPIGLGHAVEVGAFAACSVFMGWLGVIALASHQVALKMAATSFMVATALGVAAGIRVGNELGARRPDAAQRAAWVSLALGLVVMVCGGVVFVTCGPAIVGSFSADPQVIELGAALLVVAAAFQLSDGAQAIAGGALRGAGDTIQPMVAQLVAHWGIGLPLGAALAFGLGLGAREGALAIWWSLALGLTVAAWLLVRRLGRVRELRALD